MTNLNQSYHDKLSDDEKLRDAELYYSIGHEDEDMTSNNECWIWDGHQILSKEGGTHGIHFSHKVAGRNFKGWHDVEKNIISIVFPKHELRKLGDRKPTVDDIPTNVYNKLISKFGRTNRFVVFEFIKKSQLKQIIKEIVKEIKFVNENMFPKEFNRHQLGSCWR